VSRRATKKTTPARPREETVAEEVERADEDETVAVPEADALAATAPPADAAPEASPDPLTLPSKTDKGRCDNHPDSPAVLVTDFPWTPPQRFCSKCVPDQYRYLL